LASPLPLEKRLMMSQIQQPKQLITLKPGGWIKTVKTGWASGEERFQISGCVSDFQ
jgi:hypothetical protein